MNDYGLIDLYTGDSNGGGFHTTPGPNGTVVGYSAVNPRGSEHKMVKKLVTACNDVTINTNDLPLYMAQQNEAAQQMVFDVAMSLIRGWAFMAENASGTEKNYDAMIQSARIVDAIKSYEEEV